MNLITKKALAASAVAIMLLPMAASAHTNAGLNLGAWLGKGQVNASVNANVANRDGDQNRKGGNEGKENEGKKEHATSTSTKAIAHASTTAATIVKQATRLNNLADFMGSLSAVLSARIASSTLSASSTIAANAQLAGYNTAVANAKVQAVAAITAANAGALTTAKADLNAAR
ncbi:MAG: hypothetical protein AAB919_01890, partial [Patescibacteria group bacterium]